MDVINKAPGLGSIRFLSGPMAGSTFQISKSILTLGREPTNDIVITDPSVSRHHARLLDNAGQWSIEKLTPHNFVTVNAHEVEQAPISDRDTIGLGTDTSFLFLMSPALSAGDQQRVGAGGVSPGHGQGQPLSYSAPPTSPIPPTSSPPLLSSHQQSQSFLASVTWTRWLVGILLLFLVLEFGAFAFNWKWTGFKDANLWDWLNILVLPIVVAALPLWLNTRHKRQAEWRLAFLVTLVVFAVLIFGGYALNWTWTGFSGNDLWNWIRLLIAPTVVPIAALWFMTQQSSVSDQGRKQEDEAGEKDSA